MYLIPGQQKEGEAGSRGTVALTQETGAEWSVAGWEGVALLGTKKLESWPPQLTKRLKHVEQFEVSESILILSRRKTPLELI